jgi:SRF-type transcription factor (DNA-binding and dimerisation domain)
MAAGSLKKEKDKEKEKARKRRKTLVKKAYELAKLCDVDVALIVHKNGRYHTYRSIESWLPCMKQIVSSTTLIYLTPSSNRIANCIPSSEESASKGY